MYNPLEPPGTPWNPWNTLETPDTPWNPLKSPFSSKKCEMCGYNSKSDDDWKYHLATEHRYEECDECGRAFSDMNHMNKHLEQTKHIK